MSLLKMGLRFTSRIHHVALLLHLLRGSGKSTLLWALLGEVPCVSGQSHLPGALEKLQGRVAYCGPVPQLLRGSLRENILFGRPFRRSSYVAAVQSCGLSELDLEKTSSQVPQLSGTGLSTSRMAISKAYLRAYRLFGSHLTLMFDETCGVYPLKHFKTDVKTCVDMGFRGNLNASQGAKGFAWA